MEIKDKILSGAVELFFKYGIKNITMDEIAKHLGMSKKTIYTFFKDKDEMVHSLISQKICHDKCIYDKTHQDAENVVAELFAIMKIMKETLSNINPLFFTNCTNIIPKPGNYTSILKTNLFLRTLKKV
jgi:TetR/AcrR family transcriptional regulator, cholesterol catabolism regulator